MPRSHDHEGARRSASPRAPEDTPAVPRLFAPAHRTRIAVLALFLAVTGATAALAMGLHDQRAPGRNPDAVAVGQLPQAAASGSQPAATIESVDLQVARQQDVATRQYGALLHVATHDRSSKHLAAAATALQVTITPLVARATVNQRALDAARQLLTGEQVILATPPVSRDPQVHALLIQTQTMLDELPPTATASPAPASEPPSVVADPTSATVPTDEPTPTATAATHETPTPAVSRTASATPTDPPTPTDQPSAEPHATAAAPATPSATP